VYEVDARGALEQFARDVGDASIASRTVVELPGPRAGHCHQLGQTRGRCIGGDEDHERVRDEAGNRREVTHRVDRIVGVDGGVQGHRADVGHQQRVAVRRRPGSQLGGHCGRLPRAVFDDHGLTQARCELVREQPGQQVNAAAGREAHQQADGFAGPGLSNGGHCRQANDQRQENEKSLDQAGHINPIVE